jgi:hypothetical protein
MLHPAFNLDSKRSLHQKQVVKPGRSCFSFSASAMSVSVRHCPTDQPPPNYSMVQNHMYYRLSAESNIPKGVPFRHNDVSTARVFPMEAISRAHWGSNGIRPTSIPPAPWTLCPRRRILFMVRWFLFFAKVETFSCTAQWSGLLPVFHNSI